MGYVKKQGVWKASCWWWVRVPSPLVAFPSYVTQLASNHKIQPRGKHELLPENRIKVSKMLWGIFFLTEMPVHHVLTHWLSLVWGFPWQLQALILPDICGTGSLSCSHMRIESWWLNPDQTVSSLWPEVFSPWMTSSASITSLFLFHVWK